MQNLDKQKLKKEIQKITNSDKAIIEYLSYFGLPKDLIQFLFEKFKRKFTYRPKGFIDPALITRQMVIHSLTPSNSANTDMIVQAKANIVHQSVIAEIPVSWYFVEKNLAEDLDLTEPPDQIPDRFMLPDLGVLILPKGLFKNADGGINFIAYKLFRPEEKEVQLLLISEQGLLPTIIHFEAGSGYRLCWYAPDRVGYVYGGILGLEPHEFGLSLNQNMQISTGNENREIEYAEVDRLTAFLVNVLTYCSQNETEIFQVDTPTKARGFSQKSSDRIAPLFLGKEYKKIKYSGAKKGTGKSPRSHYRRGYWRSQAYGKNWQKRKMVLIQPILVGVKK